MQRNVRRGTAGHASPAYAPGMRYAIGFLGLLLIVGCGDDPEPHRPLDLSVAVDLATRDLGGCPGALPNVHHCERGPACCGPCPSGGLEPRPSTRCDMPGLQCVYENIYFTCGTDGYFNCVDALGRDCFGDAGR
jgi:hypothetical protein